VNKVFGEYIFEPTLITRFGPNTSHERAKYLKSVTGEIRGTHIVLKGYDQGLRPHDFTDVMVFLYNEGFRTCEIERIGPPHRTLHLILGPEGVVKMEVEKKRMPHPDKHKDAETGAYDAEKVADTLEMIAQQVRGGHYIMDNMELSPWNSEGVAVGSFTIRNTDPAAPGERHPDEA